MVLDMQGRVRGRSVSLFAAIRDIFNPSPPLHVRGPSMPPNVFFRIAERQSGVATRLGCLPLTTFFTPSLKFLNPGHTRSGHQVRSKQVTSTLKPVEIPWENLSDALKVTKTLANAQFSQEHIFSHPFTVSRSNIVTLILFRSSEVTRGQKRLFDYNF